MEQSTNGQTTNWKTCACKLDDGLASRAAIGLVALASDVVIEPELNAFLPKEGVGLYTNRIPMAKETTMDTLQQMENDLAATVAGLVPDDKLDVVAFGCTSGTISIGEDRVREKIQAEKPDVKCTDPITAAMKGLRTLGCQRIGVLTPYVDEVNVFIEKYLVEHGFEIVAKGSFKQAGDPEISRIPPSAIYDAALTLGQEDVDCVFLSCTAMRTSGIIALLEKALDKPVISSNQSLAWDMLRLAGYTDPVPGLGSLLHV